MDNINKNPLDLQSNNMSFNQSLYNFDETLDFNDEALSEELIFEEDKQTVIENSVNILQTVVNGKFIKASQLDESVQIQFPNQHKWTQLQITAAELLSCMQKMQNETSIKYEDSKHLLFFYKTENQKIKILLVDDAHIAKGNSSHVFAGYKLNGKSEFLKKKIIKAPRISKTQRNAIQNTPQQKEAHTKFYKLLSQDFIEEKKGIDRLHKDKKTIIGIQDPFDSFHLNGKTYLVTKQYDNDLEKCFNLPLEKKVNAAKQITLGIKEIISKNLAVVDVKIENIVYSEKEGDLEVVHIDLSPYDKEKIREEIKKKNINSKEPIKIYTPSYLHMNDLKKLQTLAINYQKTGQESFLDNYMTVSQKIMIAHLAHIFLALFTQHKIAKESEVSQDAEIYGGALTLENSTIKKRVDHFFARKIKKDTNNKSTLEEIRDLTFTLFNVNSEERPSIDFVLESLDQIKVNKRVIEKENHSPLKRIKKNLSEGN